MSRCFPFPPPEYENKARADDLNVIKKEKHKHKKHKDKKDKDKKERSKRKDKERTKGKHKEDDRKDRKQKKHREKNDKKKDERKSSEDKRKIVGPSENQNGEELGPDNNGPCNGAHNYRISVELGKRVRNDDEATDKKKEKQIVGSSENQNGEKVPGPDNNKQRNGAHGFRISVELGKRVRNDDEAKDKKKEKQIVGSSENQNGEKPSPYKNKPGDGAHDYTISAEMGKRVRNGNEATEKNDKKKEKHVVGSSENRNGEKPTTYNNKRGDGAHDYRILVEMGKRVRNDDGARDNSYASMANGQGLGVDAKGSGNNCVGNCSAEKRIKVEKNGSCQDEKRKEGKETNGLGTSVGEGDGLKIENGDKRRKKEEKKRKKEEKKKAKERSKEKIKQRAKSDGNLLDFCANKPDDLLEESWDPQGKLPKLKDPVLNGFLHENRTRPDNTPRPVVIHQVSQNGSCSHPSQNKTIPSTTEKQAVVTNQKENGKRSSSQSVLKIIRNMELGPTADNPMLEHTRAPVNNHVISNGFVPSHPLVENGRKTATPNSINKTVDVPRPVFAGEMERKAHGMNGVCGGKKDISSRPSSASVKPKAPHPDLEYLSRILIVPKVESPQFDDQEWLLGCKDVKSAKFGSSEIVECTKLVWAEAIQLESVTAMPYVVPY